MKRGLALSGGGFKGAIQVGVLMELMKDHYDEQGKIFFPARKYDVVSGISVGALIGALIALGELPTVVKLFQSVKDSQGGIITNGKLAEIKNGKLQLNFGKLWESVSKGVNFWDVTRGVFGKKGKQRIIAEIGQNINELDSVLDNSPLYKLLLETVNLENLKSEFLFGLTSLEDTNDYKSSASDFYDNLNFAKGVLASATMPVIWIPVKEIRTRNGIIKHAVDGGMRTISPIGRIFDKMKNDEEWEIDVLHTSSQTLETDISGNWNITKTAGRSLDILLNQTFVNDVKTSLFINDNAEFLNLNPNRKKEYKKAKINIFEPDIGESGGTLDATPEMIDYRIELGRQLALNYINQWRSKI
jgi:NTE family protein